LFQEGVGEAINDEAHGARIVGGGRNSEQKKKAFSSIFTTDTKSFISLVAGRSGGGAEAFSSIFTTDTRSWSIPD
jgi:hypothetical protein